MVKSGPNERRKWYLLELNQGHMDFQSIALPPELRYLFCIAFAKVRHFT